MICKRGKTNHYTCFHKKIARSTLVIDRSGNKYNGNKLDIFWLFLCG